MFLAERLGLRIPSVIKRSKVLWIHAVSVGEVLSMQKLIVKIKQDHSDLGIVFSTVTNTGFKIAREKLKGVDEVFFLPFDFVHILRKFFKALKPDILILAESEFWPNLLRTAHRSCGRVMLINGRITERSYRRFRSLKFLSRRVLSNIDRFLVQTETDKTRLQDIGVESNRLQVTGNLKAEVELPEFSEKELKELRLSLNIPAGDKVIIAGSTHKGEDEPLLKAFSSACQQQENLKFIIAPRHPRRSAEIVALGQKYFLDVKLRTELKKGENWRTLVLNTIGELAGFYALADITFIGGSLIDWGGQNLLEPAYYAKPIFFGSYMDNFARLTEFFLRVGAAREVKKEEELVAMFLYEETGEGMGKKAYETLHNLQGATGKVLNAIEDMLNLTEETK